QRAVRGHPAGPRRPGGAARRRNPGGDRDRADRRTLLHLAAPPFARGPTGGLRVTLAVQAQPLAALEGVSFSYPQPDGRHREVLRSVDLVLPRGDLVALVG